jgi:hypothetical protein
VWKDGFADYDICMVIKLFTLVVCVIGLLVSDLIASEEKIIDEKVIAQENSKILGVDKNNNEVRDEVETYIIKYLHKKNPKVYEAYLNYAQTLSLQLKYRHDKKELDKLDMQLYKDHHCIKGLDEQGANGIRKLRGKVLESYQRIRAWEISAGTKSINTFPYIDKKDYLKQCR